MKGLFPVLDKEDKEIKNLTGYVDAYDKDVDVEFTLTTDESMINDNGDSAITVNIWLKGDLIGVVSGISPRDEENKHLYPKLSIGGLATLQPDE